MEQQMLKLRDGWLRISESSDPDYPGVYVEVVDNEITTTLAQVLVEEDDKGHTRALIWHDGMNDDYDEEIDLTQPK